MQLRSPDIFRKNFSNKIAAISIFLIFCISFSLTAFFYYAQRKSLTGMLVQNNLLLARILAYNSRIGVFSENEDQLRDPIEGIFQQGETEEVAVFDGQGRLLAKRVRPVIGDGKTRDKATTAGRIEVAVLNKLQVSSAPFYLDNTKDMEFWSPVTASASFRTPESLFVEEKELPHKERTIGFVRIKVGKTVLNRQLGALLTRSALIGLVFLIAGAGIIYVMVRKIVNPLNTLRSGVQVLGKGDFGGMVPVETEDEIGELALAFNQMSASLLRRETEKKHLEERLRHSQRIEAIGTLAGGIAHDFNNIIGVIVGYAQMALLTNPEKSKLDGCLKEIFEAGIRAKDLVKQILTFSRQGAQERNPLFIKPVVEDALKMTRELLPATVEIRRNFKPGLSPIVSDPTQIHQVVMNLCTNAGYAMQEVGGVLEVELDERELAADNPELPLEMSPGRYQVLTVRDTGGGMESAVRERIFDPFFTTKGPGKGTGMGLSVVHGIVKSHGGRINCQSDPGSGTTFEVFFPTTKAEVLEISPGGEVIPGGRGRVIFVDDEASLVGLAKQMLQNFGYDVVGCTSGVEALAAFKARPDQFDLLITDNTMPNMTGIELTIKIKQIRSDLPIILCTGFIEGIAEEKIKALGIASILMKPFIWEDIAQVIRQVLDKDNSGVRS